MTRKNSFFLSLVLLVFVSATASFALPENLVDLMLNGEYDAAEERLEQLEEPDERLFGRAMVAHRRGDHRRAGELFRRLTRRHPDSPRATDAAYFLDRLQLRIDDPQPPLVRVRLARGSRISGTLTGEVRAVGDDGSTLAQLKPGERWILEEGGEARMVFRVGNRPETESTVKSLTLRPMNTDSKLAHDNTRYRGRFHFHPNGQGRVSLVNELPIDQYLYGVVRKEIAPNWPMATVKAQAVAARSFAVARMRNGNDTRRFHVGSTHISQVYGGFDAEEPRIRKAVDATVGEVLTHKNDVVPAYFHANSGGHIESAENVWNGSKTPYIVPKEDPWSRNTQHSKWTGSVARSRVVESLASSDLPRPSVPLNLERTERLPSGRTRTISYNGAVDGRVTVDANDFRMAIGPRTVKSTWFESLEESGGRVQMSGRGWGHGIGLSQWGARAMAREGHSYENILSFYYERAKLMARYGLGASRGKRVIDE